MYYHHRAVEQANTLASVHSLFITLNTFLFVQSVPISRAFRVQFPFFIDHFCLRVCLFLLSPRAHAQLTQNTFARDFDFIGNGAIKMTQKNLRRAHQIFIQHCLKRQNQNVDPDNVVADAGAAARERE